MMRSSAAKAFDLDEEPAAVHDAYGRNPFGQGCLLARRLVERGVPFVEVTLSSVDGTNGLGWDTHAQNFDAVEKLSGVLDAGWSTLMTDLRIARAARQHLDRLDGRVRPDAEDQRVRRPRPFPQRLVDRPRRWRDSRRPDDRQYRGRRRRWSRTGPFMVPDLLATVIKGLGIDPAKQNTVENGRPIRLVDLEGQTHQGNSGMIGAAAIMVLALAAAPRQEPAPASARQ